MSTDLLLDSDAFIRSIAVNRESRYALFLGAGASISSGVPSAASCIWEWKREIFLTNNPLLHPQFSEISLEATRAKIQSWLDHEATHPPDGSPAEYSHYIEACLQLREDRRQWFQNRLRNAKPALGYQVLGLLAQRGLIKSVWTTNFDGLAARACTDQGVVAIEVGLDSSSRLNRREREGELPCISLHGDYRYDALKNTSEELRTQDAQLRAGLTHALRSDAVIVCGYSGRDESVMEAFEAAYTDAGVGSLFWCIRDSDSIPHSVARVLRAARSKGYTAYCIPIPGFDDLMVAIGLHCVDRAIHDEVRKIISTSRQPLVKAAFDLPTGPHARLLKSNAFPVEMPAEAIEFDVKAWPPSGRWKWLRELTGQNELVAVPYRRSVLCLGTINRLREVFREHIACEPRRVPIARTDFGENSAVTALFQLAIVRSFAVAANLKTDGKYRLWDTDRYFITRHIGAEYIVYEALVVALRTLGHSPAVVLKPTVEVRNRDDTQVPIEVSNQIKLNTLGGQYNDKFNQVMDVWRKKLFPSGHSTFIYPPNSGSDFVFRVQPAPAFADITSRQHPSPEPLREEHRKYVTQRGIRIVEPMLVFSDRRGNPVRDQHAIRGIAANRPFDYSLTMTGLLTNVSLGVICPAAEREVLRTYLARAGSQIAPKSGEVEYVSAFPGFEGAFGLPLRIPSENEHLWLNCPEPRESDAIEQRCREFAQGLVRSVDALIAAGRPNVILIFMPNRLAQLWRYANETEVFDLHDFVKAHCVRRGVATQFLEESTTAKPLQCSIWWWLALSIYVKSMRTPFIVEALDSETAYVGLGFSVDSSAERGQHIVLGCSHLYNGRGEGLQYRLTRLKDTVLDRRGNPFMSRDDARRVGETVRQLFYESRLSLPKRVVLHKLTPFRRDERDGLSEGLGGVPCVDMIEINDEDTLRYVTSEYRAGVVAEGRFPVDRGTLIKTAEFEALLWVHGSARAMDERRTYYQGKRRIPAPLVLKRHLGSTPLIRLAAEVLALSKMNLNSFYLYTKLPVTVQSSNQIARIGSLLQGAGVSSYDYRLFV